MHINTHVVRALMALRGINELTLANIANVTPDMLAQWLHAGTDGDELIAFDTQLEILRVLGINGEAPRRDIVHYWNVHQDFFSSKKAFWAIDVMTEAFGKANVVYFAKDTDPVASMTARAHFGLQFQSFKAILEVSAHPLRNIGFDPADFEQLSWADGALVLVNQEQFEKLAPGLMTPVLYDRQLTLGREQLAWERLNSLSRETNIGPAQLEMLLQNVQQGLLTSQLTNAVIDEQVSVPARTSAAPAHTTAAATMPLREPRAPAAVAPGPVPTALDDASWPAAAVVAARDDVPVAPVKPVAVPVAVAVPAAVTVETRKLESVIDQAAASMGNQFVPRARRRDVRTRPLRAVLNTGTGSR